jgi:hypothetical protein
VVIDLTVVRHPPSITHHPSSISIIIIIIIAIIIIAIIAIIAHLAIIPILFTAIIVSMII